MITWAYHWAKCFRENLLNLIKNYFILSRLQLITNRMNGVSPSKNYPGKIITFYSAKS